MSMFCAVHTCPSAHLRMTLCASFVLHLLFCVLSGSWLHYNIECILNHLPTPTSSLTLDAATSFPAHLGDCPPLPELDQFRAFQRQILQARGIDSYRTEWRIAAPDLSLGGSVDFIGRDAQGRYVMFDWKRSKRLMEAAAAVTSTSTSPHRFRKMARCPSYLLGVISSLILIISSFSRPPLEHLEDSDLTRYSLQLNVYRHILRHYYNIEVAEMFLVAFHEESEYELLQVPMMEYEMRAMVQELQQLVVDDAVVLARKEGGNSTRKTDVKTN
jgi:hypothetical protein